MFPWISASNGRTQQITQEVKGWTQKEANRPTENPVRTGITQREPSRLRKNQVGLELNPQPSCREAGVSFLVCLFSALYCHLFMFPLGIIDSSSLQRSKVWTRVFFSIFNLSSQLKIFSPAAASSTLWWGTEREELQPRRQRVWLHRQIETTAQILRLSTQRNLFSPQLLSVTRLHSLPPLYLPPQLSVAKLCLYLIQSSANISIARGAFRIL